VSAGLAIGCALFGAIGLVWLSIALNGLLAFFLNDAAAAATVAFTFLLLPLVVLSVRAGRPSKPMQAAMPAHAEGNTQLVALVTEAAERMAPTAPMAAMAFAATGGLLSVHLPTAVTPLLVRLAEGYAEASEDASAAAA